MKGLCFYFILFVFVFFSAAPGQIPNTLNYQGMLTNADGSAVEDGEYSMTFNFYNEPLAGKSLWNETQTVKIEDGRFNVKLGEVSTLILPFDETYWLGITIQGGKELTPRIEFSASAYSISAANVMGESNIFPSEGRVGIGTKVPGEMLEVADTIYSSVGGFKFPDGTVQATAAVHSDGVWKESDKDIYYNGGNVGIGTSATDYPLHIVPASKASGIFIDHSQRSSIETSALQISLSKSALDLNPAYGVLSEASNESGTGAAFGVYGLAKGRSTGVKYGVYGEATGTGTLWAGYFNGNVYADGNLGIGTSSPSEGLEVADTIYSSQGGFKFPDGTVQATAASTFEGFSLDQAYDQGGPGLGRMITADNGPVHIAGNGGFTVNGNTGIGTTSNSNPLTIVSNIGDSTLVISNNLSSTASNSYGVVIDVTKNIGGATNIHGAKISATNNYQNGTTYGVRSTVNGTSSTTKFGIHSLVTGEGPLYGVHAQATGSGSGIKYGVYASGDDWGGYFRDNVYISDKLGISTITPNANLHIKGSLGFVVEGETSNIEGPPVEGAGRRMMWYPKKAAFRSGSVTTDTFWSDDSTGSYSVATGMNTRAVGQSSVAMGTSSTAKGDYSVALGYNTKAIGRAAVAMGYSVYAGANYSTALGYNTRVNSSYATAIGYSTTASGNYSTAMGTNTSASNFASTALGDNTIANGYASTAMGSNTIASGRYSTAMGNSTVASGEISLAIGYTTEAGGDYSTAMGSRVTVTGEGSFAIGDHSNVSHGAFGTSNRFYARFANGYRLYTSADMVTGVALAAGGVSWSVTSDSTKKENFKPVDGEVILDQISRFRLTSWNFKGQDPAAYRHYGPMAQDFYSAFGYDGIGTVGNDTTIASADFDGINFIAIQALEKRTRKIESLTDDILSVREENRVLKQKLTSLESSLRKMEILLVNMQEQSEKTGNNMRFTNSAK